MLKKVILILLAAVFFSACSNLPKVGSELPNEVSGQDYDVMGLKAAVDMGLTMKCSYIVNDASYEGYVKGKKWRGKMQQPSSNTVVDVIILEDGCMYAWGEGSKDGSKVCFDPAEFWEKEETMKDVEYKCSVTSVDDSMFVPPNDVVYINPFTSF